MHTSLATLSALFLALASSPGTEMFDDFSQGFDAYTRCVYCGNDPAARIILKSSRDTRPRALVVASPTPAGSFPRRSSGHP